MKFWELFKPSFPTLHFVLSPHSEEMVGSDGLVAREALGHFFVILVFVFGRTKLCPEQQLFLLWSNCWLNPPVALFKISDCSDLKVFKDTPHVFLGKIAHQRLILI